MSNFLNIPVETTLKSIVVEGKEDGEIVLLLLRGDHEFNDIKAEKLADVKSPLTMASAESILAQFGANGGSLGPVGFKGKVYADFATEKGADWVIGANQDDYHYTGFNFGRDAAEPEFVDLRNVVAGDPSPCGSGSLKLARGIEVGHVFQLRDKYSKAMNDDVFWTTTVKSANHGNGLLRYRYYPRCGRRHRTKQRRKRHCLDQSNGAV